MIAKVQAIEQSYNKALKAFEPPALLTVSQWADNNRLMSVEETILPGKWQTDSMPYLRFIMDCFSNEDVEEIVWLKCSQIGGTEAMLNMVGYSVDQDPARAIYVLPDDDICRDFSTERAQKMFLNSPTLKDKFKSNDSKDLLLRFNGGFLKFASSQSPSKLASWPARYVFAYEIDKYQLWTGREANPLSLVEERAKNWPNRKIVKVSTPTIKTGAIFKAYEAVSTRYSYHVPCPFCGHMQTLKQSGLKWEKREDGTSDPSIAYKTAYYECEECRQAIKEGHKRQMLQAGQWVPDNDLKHPRSVGFHINTLYSPMVTWGEMAEKFLKSKDDPSSLMNYINSWLGEPWEDKATSLDANIVLERKTEVPEGVVPNWAQLLTAGVDVQKNCIYYVVRAWGAGYTSQLVEAGEMDSLYDLPLIADKFFPDEDGELRYQVNLACIDSGYDSDSVYEFCLYHSEWAAPVKGSSVPMLPRFKRSRIDAPERGWNGEELYIVNGDQYKDTIAGRLRRPMGDGCWMVNADCSLDYASQITSEHKIITRKGNKEISTWVKKTSHAANHYFDCEVYAATAADLLHVRHLQPLEEVAKVTDVKVITERRQEQGDDFWGAQGDWLGGRNSWL